MILYIIQCYMDYNLECKSVYGMYPYYLNILKLYIVFTLL